MDAVEDNQEDDDGRGHFETFSVKVNYFGSGFYARPIDTVKIKSIFGYFRYFSWPKYDCLWSGSLAQCGAKQCVGRIFDKFKQRLGEALIRKQEHPISTTTYIPLHVSVAMV